MNVNKNKQELKKIKEAELSKNPINEKEEIEKAVAFKLNEEGAIVTSIGIGNFAKQIKKEAEEHNIPVYKDKELTETLINFDIDTPLPPSAYNLIVAFINFVSFVEKDVFKKNK